MNAEPRRHERPTGAAYVMPETTVTNQTAKHTPGPWTVDQLIGTSRRNIEPGIGQVYGLGIGPEANANLIAAAPDLLDDAQKNDAAFTWLAEQMNSITDNAPHWNVEQVRALAQDLRVGIERNQKRTRAAIAKAEGRS